MSDEFADILEDHGESCELEGVARMLHAERPRPRAVFRGGLGRRLRSSGTRPVPRWVPLCVLSLGVAGALLLGLAGLGVAGHGSLAPSRHAAAATASSGR